MLQECTQKLFFAIKGITFSDDDQSKNEKKNRKKKELKEYLGHTPFEVLGGALLGIVIALVMPMSL